MLSSETKVVTYVNKKGERSTYPLNSAMESANLEMVKRLKYTKDILTHMLNANAANTAKGVNDEKVGANAELPIDPTEPVNQGQVQTTRQASSGQPVGPESQPRVQATERTGGSRPFT